ncbi:hypothetical protein [Paraliomyxa miuraensis]|uniref:hypothetical protein n=1 Tax=Paraliomyxa miuraensis TaxID=376150 RepID=UPI002256077D|nr:hypothetical protein [Paraliomyxa miuraensis]MCX4239158.1 hypothetical protein [Paraliomyxa miuraensis]
MTASTRAHGWGIALATGVGFLSLALASEAQAAPTPGQKIRGRGGNFGIGLSLGDPMGASMKYFMAPNHSIQGDLGWAPLHHGHGRLGFDYLWHPGTFVSNSTIDLVPYLGLGIGMAFWAGYYHGYHGACGGYYDPGHPRYDECYDRRDYYYHRGGGGVAMLLRAPILGLGIHWKKAPLDTMFEGSWSPYLVLPHLPHGDFSFKIRYYF